MTAVRAPHRGDPRGMAGNRQPVMNSGPDRPRSSGGSPLRSCPVISSKTRLPRQWRARAPGRSPPRPNRGCGREGRASGRALPVRSAVAGPSCRPGLPAGGFRLGAWGSAGRGAAAERGREAQRSASAGATWAAWELGVARQRPDRCGNLCPKRRFFSGQAAHGPPLLGEAGSAPGPWRTCRPPSAWPPRRRPRRCRTGWRL